MPGSNAEPSARTSCGNVTLGDYILHLAACDPQPTMSDLANLPGVSRRGRIVGWSSLACWTVALGLTSFALSAITVTARWQLWLGPQTVILGSVGLCVGAMIALLARQFARGVAPTCWIAPCCRDVASAPSSSLRHRRISDPVHGASENSQLGRRVQIPVPSQDVCPLPALEFSST